MAFSQTKRAGKTLLESLALISTSQSIPDIRDSLLYNMEQLISLLATSLNKSKMLITFFCTLLSESYFGLTLMNVDSLWTSGIFSGPFVRYSTGVCLFSTLGTGNPCAISVGLSAECSFSTSLITRLFSSQCAANDTSWGGLPVNTRVSYKEAVNTHDHNKECGENRHKWVIKGSRLKRVNEKLGADQTQTRGQRSKRGPLPLLQGSVCARKKEKEDRKKR